MATGERGTRSGKKVSSQAKTGQLGVNVIERIVLDMGSVWHPSNQSLEAGVDGEIELVDPVTNVATNAVVRVQSKATARRPLDRETEDGFDWTCDDRDLEYWLGGNVPVILIVVRVDSGDAYWVSIADYFTTSVRKKTRRVHFDKKSMAFTSASYPDLSRIAVPKKRGLYSAPRPVEETLYSSLLEVIGVPERLWLGETDLRAAGDVFARLRESGLGGGEFVLRDQRILSAHDLTERPWSEFVDRGTVEEHTSSYWAKSEDPELVRRFLELLGRCLTERCRQIGCVRRRDDGLYYFAPTRNLERRSVPYRSIRDETKRDVFLPYLYSKGERLGEVAYYRHSAFYGQFSRFEGRWFLEIEPTYHFTSDGKRQHPFYERYLRGIKQLEKNGTVLGQVVMWAALLRGREEDDDGFFARSPYPNLRFGRLATFNLEVGIDDSMWLPNEDAPTARSVDQTAGDLPLFEEFDLHAPSLDDVEQDAHARPAEEGA